MLLRTDPRTAETLLVLAQPWRNELPIDPRTAETLLVVAPPWRNELPTDPRTAETQAEHSSVHTASG